MGIAKGSVLFLFELKQTTRRCSTYSCNSSELFKKEKTGGYSPLLVSAQKPTQGLLKKSKILCWLHLSVKLREPNTQNHGEVHQKPLIPKAVHQPFAIKVGEFRDTIFKAFKSNKRLFSID